METFWNNLFHLDLSVAEKIVRPILVYMALLLGLRLAGKRELAQLNAFDLVVLLMLSNTVQNAIIGPDNSMTGGLIGATALLTFNYILTRYLARHERVEKAIEGEETVLVKNGKLVTKNVRGEGISHTDILMAAQKQGFHSIEEIGLAALQPGGGISFERPEGQQGGGQQQGGGAQQGDSQPDAMQREILERLERIERMLSERGSAS